MENIDTEKPTSSSEIAPSNAQGEVTSSSPTTAEETLQPANEDPKKSEREGEHDVLTEIPEAKKVEEPSVANTQAGQSAPSDSSSSNPSPVPTAPTPSYVHPVKRFSAVSVNKKFLEKASSHTSTTGGAQPTSSINTSKPTATIARPSPQSASSHLRLVTSKVTGNTLLSTSPGPGWSRPQSVTPPAPSPSSQTPPSGSHGPIGASQNVAPGRLTMKPKGDGISSASRPVWRNIGSSAKPNISSESEFPTAAEAAKGEKAKSAELKAAQVAVHEAVAAQQAALSETADAFRGVHLDPNEDHWDEMDEEEDNEFLGGVIEFGDGMQYTIHVSSSAQNGVTTDLPSDAPVRKEERFADDFDRSWPKSAASESHDDVSVQRKSSSDTSSNVSHSPVSVRDPSQPRVLFNERLNRMEPASMRSDKREQPDVRGRLVEKPDGAPAGSHSRVLLLNKSQHPTSALTDGSSHSSRYTGESRRDDPFESGSTISQSSDEPRKPWGPRDGLPSRPNVPGSSWVNGRRDPSNSRETSSVASSLSNAENGKSAWGGRSGPPKPDPRHLRTGREGERQLPPHLQKSPTDAWKEPPWAKHPPEPLQSEPPQPQPEMSARRPSIVETKVIPAEPPQISTSEEQKPAVAQVPAEVPAEVPDVNELQKIVLQDSAERAKRRRQQEEEERLKAQERAKKKAAEVEARMLAGASVASTQKLESQQGAETIPPRPSEAQVNKFIEEAISTATNAQPPPLDRLPKRTPSYFKEAERRPVLTPHDAPARPQLISDRVDSWRSKPTTTTEPPRQLSEVKAEEKVAEKPVTFITAEINSLDVQAGENLEVVDFSDMAKLVGESASSADAAPMHHGFMRRPVASDFFEEKSRSDLGPWRNTTDNTSMAIAPVHARAMPEATNANNGPRDRTLDAPSHKPSSIDVTQHPPEFHAHPSHYPTSPRFPKSPLQAYREAPLSALDDTMSRIKGALDGMQSGKLAKESNGNSSNEESNQEAPVPQAPEPVKVEKWLPPAKRSAAAVKQQPLRTNLELFAITCSEPPATPTLSTDSPVVHLPKGDTRKTWIRPKKYPLILKNTTCYVRWDILSFDPPVEGMTKKSLSLNDVLFRRPQGVYKKGFKYTVVIPKPTDIQRQPAFPHSNPSLIRVNLSLGSSKSFPSNRNGALEQSSWRTSRTVSCSSAPEPSLSPPKVELNVTSRSPPPDPSSLRLDGSTSEALEDASKVPSGAQPLSMKSKGPQMPAGASIAFYRNARGSLDMSTTSRKVSFTVSSELDDNMEAQVLETVLTEQPVLKGSIGTSIATETRMSSVERMKAAIPSSPDISDDQDSDRIQNKILARSIDSLLATTPPPSQPSSNSWAKSPARVPDPEHLKAVWSQASDKDNTPTVNSLKAIADDLTAVPFSISDVKSDDGGTPPPAASQPSRMSASEVTKAFQMVPPAPASTMSPASVRTSLFTPAVTSPLTTAKQLKPMSTGMTHPPQNGVMRAPYAPYPHMTAHTPSPPTLMYPHHMAPNGMQHSPSGTPYGHPVWMHMGPPMHHQAPHMMRGQQGTPYNPYHAQNGATNGIYPPSAPHPGAQTPGAGYPGIPPSQMMVSPVMAHSAPVPPHMMYGASPVLLPVPPPGAPPQSQAYPGTVGMGRAGVPVRNSSDTRTAQTSSHTTATSRFTAPSYSQISPQPFVRSTW